MKACTKCGGRGWFICGASDQRRECFCILAQANRVTNNDAADARQWQPIETAPRDSASVIDGWDGERVVNLTWAHPSYSKKGYCAWCKQEYDTSDGWESVEVKGLTHWMQIPDGPGAAINQGGGV